ncbi:Transposase [Cordylochernes scorpioides]|uniref:Transposase n=1 Tax=Cordylochernes scorpioides TaxID=51811 RepID=A0ABY6LUB3_9ARAC|nr:Transposase [Cordylochernes scorpioides]
MPGHRKRRQFKQTDAFTRGMVIGLKRAGWSIRQIAADTHLGASTVHRLWRRWLEQGNVAIYRNVGATRVTSARVDRRILRQAVAAPQATCTAILQHVQDTLDHSSSTRTISRRLVANGLHSCRPLRRLPLTPPNRRQRLEWCRARSTWMTESHRVVFSDESRFCLSSDSRRVRVWRRRGERSNPAAIVERPTVRQRGIMVWGAIAYDSRSPLLRIQGTMTAQRYVDDVLRQVTLPYLQGVPNALYQQDNARPHTARISQQALQDVQMLPWPPYSPDLSPIKHVWDIIGRRLHALPQPRSEDELWQMVEREWRAIPQDAIRTLIDSLPRRVAACIAVREFGDIHLLLYADDIAIIGESRMNLQKKFKILKEYLDENLMTLNESKSKIMVFRNGEHKDLLDSIQDIFIRRFLNLPRHTPGYIIRLETGRISLSVTALKLTLKYWLRVLNMSSDRLPRICFNRTRELSNASGTPIGFIKKLTNLLNNNGSPALVSCDDPETLRSAITGLLKTAADQSIQNDLTRI